MSRIFISSLGLGDYTPLRYTFEGTQLESTAYIQRALLEARPPEYFDRVLLLLTPSAREKHWEPAERENRNAPGVKLPTLRVELTAEILPPARLILQPISENITDPAEQWNWFQALLDHVQPGDDLYIDMTHGFRVVPIVLSAALNYLQAIKGARLCAVYYAADQAEGHPVVDFKDFYAIGQWADGVSRLIENADAGKLAQLARGASNRHFPAFDQPALVTALETLTGLLKNIDVNAVAQAARTALETLSDELDRLGPTASAERQLIQLALDKFAGLVTQQPPSGRYDLPYLRVQLEVSRLLLEHGFLMQAFTVLRELVGSIGMFALTSTKYGGKAMDGGDGRKYRHRFAELFIRMLQFDREGWRFGDDEQRDVATLLPIYEQMMAVEVDGGSSLRAAIKGLVDIRNGFDHAWTSVSVGARPSADRLAEIEQAGQAVRARLVGVVDRLGA